MQIREARAEVLVMVGALVSAGMIGGCGHAGRTEGPRRPPIAEAPIAAEPPEPPPEPRMPAAVRSLLSRRCGACHTSGARDRAGWGSVLDLGRLIEARFIVPGEPGASKLIALVAAGEMPQKGPPLRPREIERLARWIVELGASAVAAELPPP